MYLILHALKIGYQCKNIDWQSGEVSKEIQKNMTQGIIFISEKLKDSIWIAICREVCWTFNCTDSSSVSFVSVYRLGRWIAWTSSPRRTVSHLSSSPLCTSQCPFSFPETVNSSQQDPCISGVQLPVRCRCLWFSLILEESRHFVMPEGNGGW